MSANKKRKNSANPVVTQEYYLLTKTSCYAKDGAFPELFSSQEAAFEAGTLSIINELTNNFDFKAPVFNIEEQTTWKELFNHWADVADEYMCKHYEYQDSIYWDVSSVTPDECLPSAVKNEPATYQ